MVNNYLITGYWGEPHVTVENDRGINAAIFGAGRFVLPVGNQFRAEYIGNNTVRVYDGKLINNGAFAGIPAGQYVDLLIPETGQGMTRNDLIVFQYSKNTETLVESGNFVVIHGAESSKTASDPELTQQDILTDTATFDQMPLYRVSVSNTIISAPEQLFTVNDNLATIFGALSRTMAQLSADMQNTLNGHTDDKENPHGVTAEQAGAAPILHRSASETYGKGSSVYYGHVKLSDATDNTSGVSGGIAATPAAVKAAYDEAGKKAPKDHASTANTYGLGTATNYGHVKLAKSFDAKAADGLAASAELTTLLYTYFTELVSELDSISQAVHNLSLVTGATVERKEN